jgi:hypothetical protein
LTADDDRGYNDTINRRKINKNIFLILFDIDTVTARDDLCGALPAPLKLFAAI